MLVGVELLFTHVVALKPPSNVTFDGTVMVLLIMYSPCARRIILSVPLKRVRPYVKLAGFALVPAAPLLAPLGVTYTKPHSWALSAERLIRSSTSEVYNRLIMYNEPMLQI
jgi:hypothetical protein